MAFHETLKGKTRHWQKLQPCLYSQKKQMRSGGKKRKKNSPFRSRKSIGTDRRSCREWGKAREGMRSAWDHNTHGTKMEARRIGESGRGQEKKHSSSQHPEQAQSGRGRRNNKSGHIEGIHRQEPMPDSPGTCRQRRIPCIRIDHLQDTQEKRYAEAQVKEPQAYCEKARTMCCDSAQPGMVLGHNVS